MAVTFDAVGPASAPASSTASASLSWTHTTGAITNGALVVGLDLCSGADGSLVASCTYNGVAMTALVSHKETTSGSGGGCMYLWGLAGGNIVASAGKTVAITVTGGTPADLIAGSLSFGGVGQASPFGTPVSANTDSVYTVVFSSTTAGNYCAGFCATGFAIGAISSGTQEYTYNIDTSNSTGSGAGGIAASTGSAVTIGWASGGSSSVRAGVELQAVPSPGTPQPPQYLVMKRPSRVAEAHRLVR